MINWDLLFQKSAQYVSGLHASENNKNYSDLIKIFTAMRLNSTTFRIDMETKDMCYDIGKKIFFEKASVDLKRMIRLPYERTVLIVPFNREKSDGITEVHYIIQDIKNKISVGYAFLDINNPNRVAISPWVWVLDREKDSGNKYLYNDFDVGHLVPVENKDEFLKDNLGSFGNDIIGIIGFALALSTKGLLNSKDITEKHTVFKGTKKLPCIETNTYKQVTLSLRSKEHLEYIRDKEANGDSRARRLHMRRGHFKQRKTGLFWWSPHLAGKEAEYTIAKDYEVRAQ